VAIPCGEDSGIERTLDPGQDLSKTASPEAIDGVDVKVGVGPLAGPTPFGIGIDLTHHPVNLLGDFREPVTDLLVPITIRHVIGRRGNGIWGGRRSGRWIEGFGRKHDPVIEKEGIKARETDGPELIAGADLLDLSEPIGVSEVVSRVHAERGLGRHLGCEDITQPILDSRAIQTVGISGGNPKAETFIRVAPPHVSPLTEIPIVRADDAVDLEFHRDTVHDPTAPHGELVEPPEVAESPEAEDHGNPGMVVADVSHTDGGKDAVPSATLEEFQVVHGPIVVTDGQERTDIGKFLEAVRMDLAGVILVTGPDQHAESRVDLAADEAEFLIGPIDHLHPE
jgi:hypothetical protein